MTEHAPARTPQSMLVSPGTLVLCGMIAAAVVWRLLVNFSAGGLPWNFTPIEAMALFGGAYFSSRKAAIVVPLLAMAVADLVIATTLPALQVNEWLASMPVVYGCIALTAVAGFALRGRVRVWNTLLAAAGSATGFYLITNFVPWLTSPMDLYPHTWAGLVACYVAGWPFYEHGTLAGTLLWSALLFGGFALMGRRWSVLRLTTAH